MTIFMPPIKAKGIRVPHIKTSTKLDFRDTLLVPRNSKVSSRKDVNLKVSHKFKHSGRELTGVPLVASNMDTIGTMSMFAELSNHDMMTCLSKHVSKLQLCNYLMTLESAYTTYNFANNYLITCGTKESELNDLTKLSRMISLDFICIDVANGYLDTVDNAISTIRENHPDSTICVGNVVTAKRTKELINRGADIVKIGIGSGSVCTTRLKTGVGYPQLSAILECGEAAHDLGGHIMSDGGITCPGDICKALAAGADFVMLGSMLAGHNECAGYKFTKNDKEYMRFYGMASDTALDKYHDSNKNNKYRTNEGKTIEVPYKGPVENTVLDILGGLRSCCTYLGVDQLAKLSEVSEFIKVGRQVNEIYN